MKLSIYKQELTDEVRLISSRSCWFRCLSQWMLKDENQFYQNLVLDQNNSYKYFSSKLSIQATKMQNVQVRCRYTQITDLKEVFRDNRKLQWLNKYYIYASSIKAYSMQTEISELRKNYEELLEGDVPSEIDSLPQQDPFNINFSYLFAQKPSPKLTYSDCYKMYEFNRNLVPEAFEQFYYRALVTQDADSTQDQDIKMESQKGKRWKKGSATQSDTESYAELWKPSRSPSSGCIGLQNEFVESKSLCILHRQVTQQLYDILKNKSEKQLYLDGPSGSGKSIIMAALVERLRQEGWLVLYVPQGLDFTHGGMFFRNKNTGLWDTPNIAQRILKSFLQGHKEEVLKSQPCVIENQNYESLYNLCNQGSKSVDPEVICAAAVQLKEELQLCTNMQTMIAIDSYNALFYQTEYGYWQDPKIANLKYNKDQQIRRNIYPWELTVCRSFRILSEQQYFKQIKLTPQSTQGDSVDSFETNQELGFESPIEQQLGLAQVQQKHLQEYSYTGNTICLGASSYALQKPLRKGLISRGTVVSCGPNTKKVHIKRFNMYELQAMLDYYALNGWTGILADWTAVQRLAALSNCNGNTIRKQCNFFLEDTCQYYDVTDREKVEKLLGDEQKAKGVSKNESSLVLSNISMQHFRGWDIIKVDGKEYLSRPDVPQVQNNLEFFGHDHEPMFDSLKY